MSDITDDTSLLERAVQIGDTERFYAGAASVTSIAGLIAATCGVLALFGLFTSREVAHSWFVLAGILSVWAIALSAYRMALGTLRITALIMHEVRHGRRANS